MEGVYAISNIRMKTHAGYEFVKKTHGISEYRLKSNGLTVLTMEDHSAPLVGVNIIYRVGSRFERTGETGATHMLEHMLFKGSKKFDKKAGTDIWQMLENTGSVINASTYLDRTNYYEIGPRHLMDLFLEIESDRMRNAYLRDEDLKSEREVIVNEHDMYDNDPDFAIMRQVYAAAFTAHGYHHETIGWRDDIIGMSTERLRAFYDRYYYPANATLLIAGDIETADALNRARRVFGGIANSHTDFPYAGTAEPKQEGARRVTVERHGGESILILAHKVPPALHKDTAPLILLADALGDGRSSRLYRALVDTGAAHAVSTFAMPFHDEHLIVTVVKFSPRGSADNVEKIVLGQYGRLTRELMGTRELQRVQERYESQNVMLRDGVRGMVSLLTESVATGDWRMLFTLPEQAKRLTPKQLRDTAARYFKKETSTTGLFKPL